MRYLARVIDPDSRLATQLSTLACVLGVLLVSYQAAGVTWRLWPLSHAPPAPPPAADLAKDTGASEISTRAITSAALFGRATSASADTTPASRDAPETSLALTLRGILFNTDPTNGFAIIEANGDAQIYAADTSVPGGARITEIYDDRVILKRNGRLETLRLPEAAGEAMAGVERSRKSATGAGGAGQDAADSKDLNGLREQLVTDPTALQRYLRASPVTDGEGEIRGFRIAPGSDRSLFERTGLRQGDVIKRIGNTAITGQAAAMKAMQQLTASDRVTIVVERDGATRRIMLDFEA